MIIFTSDRELSREEVDAFRRSFRWAYEAGVPFVLSPGWKIQEVANPVMAGSLVDYLNQLGDA